MRWRAAASCPASAAPTCDPDSNPTPFLRACVVQHHVGLLLRHPVPLLLRRPLRLRPQHPARLLLLHHVRLLLLHPARMLQQQPVTPNPSFPCGGVLQHSVRLLQHQPVTTTLTMTPGFMCVNCLRRFLVSSPLHLYRDPIRARIRIRTNTCGRSFSEVGFLCGRPPVKHGNYPDKLKTAD